MKLKIGSETIGMLEELIGDQEVFLKLKASDFSIENRALESVEVTVNKLIYELEDHMINTVHEEVSRTCKRSVAMAMLAALVAVQEHLGAHFSISDS